MKHRVVPIVCLLMLGAPAACSPAPPPAKVTAKPVTVQSIVIRIDEDGHVFWNGKDVDQATLDSLMRGVAEQKPQPSIHLEPDRLANYSAVARVLASAQRAGATHLGFTGIETMP